MLYIEVRRGDGSTPHGKYYDNPAGIFQTSFKKEWLADSFVQKAIEEVDGNSLIEYRGDYLIDSPVLGLIAPEQLSSGCKALILLRMRPLPLNGNRMGDNCYPLVVELARVQDVQLVLGYLPEPVEWEEAVFLNSNKHTKTAYEFDMEFLRLLSQRKMEYYAIHKKEGD